MTVDARNALYRALLESHARGDGVVTSEDILFGLTYKVHTDDCGFCRLHQLGEDWRLRVGRGPMVVNSTEVRTALVDYKHAMSEQAIKVMQNAIKEANRDRQFWIDTDHLQRGLLTEDSKAKSLLEEAGYTMDETRRLGQRGRERYPPKEPGLKIRLARYPLFWPAVGFVGGVIATLIYLHSQQ